MYDSVSDGEWFCIESILLLCVEVVQFVTEL